MARNPILIAGVVLLALWAGPAAAGAHVKGLWATEGGKSHVRIEACDGRLCGSIVWLKEPMDEQGRPKVDANNEDEVLKKRPILGLALLSGFIADSDEENVWIDGEIYNPEDGETYSCTMTLRADGSLRVRGYIGVPLFGKTQIWQPVKQ